jgi:hypothetical protein
MTPVEKGHDKVLGLPSVPMKTSAVRAMGVSDPLLPSTRIGIPRVDKNWLCTGLFEAAPS